MDGQGQTPQPNPSSGQNPANPNKKRRRWFNKKRKKNNNPQNPALQPNQPGQNAQGGGQQKPGQNRPQQGGGNFQRQPQNRNTPFQDRKPQARPVEPPVVREYVEIPEELMPDRPPSIAPELIANPNNCPLCAMPVRSHYTALRHRESGELAHFDCIVRELAKENSSKLGKGRRIYYIGGGKFALVKEIYDRRGHFRSYEVIEKFDVEPRERS